MTEKKDLEKKGGIADWFMRGSLARLGVMFDRFTGREWAPSSSLATSGLIEQLKNLLDAEAKSIPGKGTVVPHSLKLKMQWDKFSTDKDESIAKLRNELLAAAADHINDSLYYTLAPLRLDITPDYFTVGVKLYASFGEFGGDSEETELNVTMPAMNLSDDVGVAVAETNAKSGTGVAARFEIGGIRSERQLNFPASGPLTVGRSGENDLVLDHASVSKQHASVAADSQSRLAIADTGSTNGTFVNGERISYGNATRLEVDDVVTFGEIEVVFEVIPQPPQEAAGAPDAKANIAREDSQAKAQTQPVTNETDDSIDKAASPTDEHDDKSNDGERVDE